MGLESFAAQPLNDSYMDLDDINMPASLYAAPVVSWTPFGVPVPDTCPSLGEIAEVIRPLAPVEAMEVDMTPPPPPTVPALATLSWTRHGALSVRAARRIKAEAACLPPAPIGPLIAQPPVVPSPPLTDEEWELAQLPTLRPPSLVAARDIIMPPESDEDEEEEERPRRRMTFIAAAAGEIIWKELSQIFLRCDISFRDEPIIVRSLREKLEQFQVSGYKDVVVENVLNDIYRRARLMRNTKAQEYYQRMPGYELIGNPYGITRNIKLEY